MKAAALLGYSWLTYRRDQLWFPLAALLFFAALLPWVHNPVMRFNVGRAYLGFVVPLIGGVLAAHAVLDDPAIELRFSTPVRPAQILLSRVGLALAIQIACAVAFQLYAAALGVHLWRLAWFLPALALTAAGTAGSLLGAQTSIGAFLAAGIWLVQLMTKSWWQQNARGFYLFLAVLVPDDPNLALNQAALAVQSAALLLLAWRLLHRPERFL